jgi:hypothetical protein
LLPTKFIPEKDGMSGFGLDDEEAELFVVPVLETPSQIFMGSAQTPSLHSVVEEFETARI